MQLEMDFGDTKRCTKCKETKDTVEFNKQKGRKDVLYCWCKSCAKGNRAAFRAHRIANPPPIPKRCNKCKETKDTVEFNKGSGRKDGLHSWCRSCDKENHAAFRAHRIANPPPIPSTKRCSTCKETKDAAEFYKKKASKDGLQSVCRGCSSVGDKLFKRKNTKRNTLAGPPDRTGTKKCTACGETKQKTEFSVAASRKDGLNDSCKTCSSASTSQWQKDNPAKTNANSARRRARKLKATPSWEDKRKTQWYYDESQRISQETGVAHHVDHMVPLNHWSVRGLHWHMNFDIIPGAENCSKNNRFWSGDGWSDWSDYYWEFEEEFVQLKEYAKWLKSLTSHARAAHLATLTTSTQLRAKATVTHVATATVTSANERNNEKTCQPSA